MTQATARTDLLRGDGVVVRRPRPSDAIGKALRKAFAPEPALPGELMRSLDALDTAR